MSKRGRPPSSPKSPPVLNPDTAAIDVGGERHFVAVPPDRDPQPVRSFGPFTADLAAMAGWLKACRVRSVVLESTGVYWIPVYDALEAAGLEVVLVDPRTLARHLRRKSDVADCQWLQELHSFGMLRGCFRPDGLVRELRALWRHRAHLVAESGKLLQMVQKTLVQMNVHLHLAVSDVAGVTGMKILRAIAKGERDPKKLARLRDKACRRSEEEIAKALEGTWRPEHLFELRQLLKAYDFLAGQVRQCDREAAKVARKFGDRSGGAGPPPAAKRADRGRSAPELDGREIIHRMTGVDLVAVEGFGSNTALTVLAETGPDLANFPSAKHFAAWTGLAPRRDKSGKRDRRAGPPARGASRVAQAFRLAARSLARSGSALGQYLRRLKGRLGPAVAIRATATKLAKLFWTLVTKKRAYRPEDAAAYAERERQRQLKRLEKQARRAGMKLVPA